MRLYGSCFSGSMGMGTRGLGRRDGPVLGIWAIETGMLPAPVASWLLAVSNLFM